MLVTLLLMTIGVHNCTAMYTGLHQSFLQSCCGNHCASFGKYT